MCGLWGGGEDFLGAQGLGGFLVGREGGLVVKGGGLGWVGLAFVLSSISILGSPPLVGGRSRLSITGPAMSKRAHNFLTSPANTGGELYVGTKLRAGAERTKSSTLSSAGSVWGG